jgi:hypothetical protein
MEAKRQREEGDAEDPMYQEDRLRVVALFEAVGGGAGETSTAETIDVQTVRAARSARDLARFWPGPSTVRHG